MLGVVVCPVNAGSPQDRGQPSEKPKTGSGLLANSAKAFQGYTLISPLRSNKTHLIDMQGREVRTWESKYTAGPDAHLLPNGHLLRAAKLSDSEAFFAGAGPGGRIQEFTWEGQVVWDFKYHNQKQIQHHAITRMPNGNVMMIVWERKTAKEAIEAGVKPEIAGQGEVLVDALVEIQPAGKTGGKVVWEWRPWDHLIQDHDQTKANYGDVAAHPELVDANFIRNPTAAFTELAQLNKIQVNSGQPTKGDSKEDALNKLKSIGYVGAGGGKKFAGFFPDWLHANAVSYNAKLDQVMVTCLRFSEIWIIDHSTTKAEAASHRGGRSGKGGDLLYRWGNPQAYRAGMAEDQRLFAPHDGHWIPEGLPGQGQLLVFNNGSSTSQSDGQYSSVTEVVLPVDAQGRYAHKPGTAFGPDRPVWSYTAPKKTDFFVPGMGSAQRLPNGNTLISTGQSGTIFEVTPEKEIVWNYMVPADSGPNPVRSAGSRDRLQLVPLLALDKVQLTPAQRKHLEEYQKELSGKLDKMLTDEQKKQLKEMRPIGAAGGWPQVGLIMPEFLQDRLKMTAEQKKQVRELQKEADGTLEHLLTGDQREQIKVVEETLKAAFAARVGVGPSASPLFRALRYSPNYPGLVGKDLTPRDAIGDLKPKEGATK
jgi:hypothetical protein